MNPRLVAVLSLLVFVPTLTTDAVGQRRRGRQQSIGARWAHDGKHVIVRNDWYDPTTWKKVSAVAEPAKGKRPRNPLMPFLDAVNKTRDKKAKLSQLTPRIKRSTLPRATVANPGAHMSEDKTRIIASFDGELWAWTKDGAAKKLSSDVKGMRHFYMAKPGNAASYIHGNNLFVANADTGAVHQVTKDGGENTFNGELDWVYQEEVYGRYNFKATWWAPNGKHVAFMRTDETGVDTFNVVDHIPNQLNVEQLKYPKAGRINPRATLRVADTSGKSIDVDLSKYKESDEILIVRVGWNPSGDTLIYMVQNRIQNWLDLNFADPKTGESRTVIHEESNDSWVERLPMPRWLKDGSFIWESDRTGYRHFYRYAKSGKLLNTISEGPWNASRIIKLDEDGGWMGFAGSTANYSIGQHAYYAKLDGSVLNQVTKDRGSHSVSFSGDGSMVIDTFQSLENPGEQWLRKNDGTPIRRILKRNAPKGAKHPTWKQIKARDGETLDLTYSLPANFDPNEKYPVLVSIYSGPAAPSVRDAYRGPARGAWFIQMSVNVRSATQRGMKFTKTCYKQFGVQELKDIEDAVDWLCKHPWADAERVGINGWSYGGFMTAFALTHSKKFKCGIAGAGVYDWGLYDTIYTERYMSTPQLNPEGYLKSSVVAAAGNLHGQLLIVHGTMDDNVHMQNAIQFIHALQKAGKTNFEFMLYPESRHGVRSRHLQMLNQKFLRKNL